MFFSRRPGYTLWATKQAKPLRFWSVKTVASPTTPTVRREFQLDDAFQYTSGRWLYNEKKRLEERRLDFDVSTLAKVAAASLGRDGSDVQSIDKIGEGGFNRVFKVALKDGFELVARLPYPHTRPKRLAVASEVATMKYMRGNGIPVPEIYGYSCDAVNPVGAEYILMESVRGKLLGDTWFTLSDKEMVKVLSGIVDIEAKLFGIEFPAYGSIYDDQDLPKTMDRTQIKSGSLESYCIGPDASLKFWFEERSAINFRRGPSMSVVDVLHRAADKEKIWLRAHGKPRFPFDRVLRDITDYKKSDPYDHLHTLDMFLQVAPYLVPEDKWLHRPTLRHPDLNPNNIFVSEDHQVTGIIDWQYANILPLCLNAGVPAYLQNYGDPESANLIEPRLAADFAEMDDEDQAKERELYRRRFIHYFYVAATAKKHNLHFEALMYKGEALRRRIYQHASEPWEGNNIPLKADLVMLRHHWKDLASQATSITPPPPCLISFDEQDAEKILDDMTKQEEAEENMNILREAVGINSDGWVSNERYEDAAAKATEMKAQAIECAEDDFEREMTVRHWPWDDHDEK